MTGRIRTLLKALKALKDRSSLRIGANETGKSPRTLPIGLSARIWLSTPVLMSTGGGLAGVLLLVWVFTQGQLPTSVLLLFEKQIAQGVVDHVVERTERDRQNIKQTTYVFSYHFQLANGLKIAGQSNASFALHEKNDAVSVEYVPSRPQSNRIVGTSASENVFGFWGGLALLLAGSIALIKGLWDADRNRKLLAGGLLSHATVTHCAPKDGSAWQIGVGEITVPMSGTATSTRLLLADFQRKAFEQHRAQFDSHGRYKGTTMLRSLHITLAFFFGGLLGTAVAFIATAALGQPQPLVILAATLSGGLIFAVVESIWRVLLRYNVQIKQEDPPSDFRDASCILQFRPVDGPLTAEFSRPLTLRGDTSDADPRPVLYLKNQPGSAKFLDELGLSTSTAGEGGIVVQADDGLPRVLFVIAAMLLACIAGISFGLL